MGGQANFCINCNFSLPRSTGVLIVYEIGFPGRREVRSDLLPGLSLTLYLSPLLEGVYELSPGRVLWYWIDSHVRTAIHPLRWDDNY